MRVNKLIKFTDAERASLVRQFNDINAAEAAEHAANTTCRKLMIQMAIIFEKAREFPEDEDCQRLLRALRRLVDPFEGIDNRSRASNDTH